MGPLCEKWLTAGPPYPPYLGTRPWDGLIPVTPLKLDGMRTLPPPSLPVASEHNPAISAAAAPPLLPPGV